MPETDVNTPCPVYRMDVKLTINGSEGGQLSILTNVTLQLFCSQIRKHLGPTVLCESKLGFSVAVALEPGQECKLKPLSDESDWESIMKVVKQAFSSWRDDIEIEVALSWAPTEELQGIKGSFPENDMEVSRP